jgi:hypothetical protein
VVGKGNAKGKTRRRGFGVGTWWRARVKKGGVACVGLLSLGSIILLA